MMRAGQDTQVMTETNVTNVVYSTAVSRVNAYGWDVFLFPTFVAVAPLAIASAGWNATTNIITSAAHGYQTGVVVRATTTTTLPTGVSASTDYWVIRLTADTFALAASLALAVAGTKLDFTDAGTGDHTLTQQTDVSTFVVQVSPNGSNWATLDSMTPVSCVAAVHKHFETAAEWVRLAVTTTKGAASIDGWILSKG